MDRLAAVESGRRKISGICAASSGNWRVDGRGPYLSGNMRPRTRRVHEPHGCEFLFLQTWLTCQRTVGAAKRCLRQLALPPFASSQRVQDKPVSEDCLRVRNSGLATEIHVCESEPVGCTFPVSDPMGSGGFQGGMDDKAGTRLNPSLVEIREWISGICPVYQPGVFLLRVADANVLFPPVGWQGHAFRVKDVYS